MKQRLILLLFMILTVMIRSEHSAAQAAAGKPTGKISQNEPVKKLIFLPFYNESGDPRYSWIENSITNSIDSTTRDLYKYMRIPDTEWQTMKKKTGLSDRDMIDTKKLSKLGKELGTEGIIFGYFNYNASTNQLKVTGKLLSVIDGDVLASKTIESPITDNLFIACDEVAAHLADRVKDLFVPTDSGALWRTALMPPWGYYYKQRTNWGHGWAVVFGTAFLTTSAFSIDYLIKKSDYINYEPAMVLTPEGETALVDPDGSAKKFDSLKKDVYSSQKNLIYSSYVMLGLYTVSLIQIYFIQADSGNIKIAGIYQPEGFLSVIPRFSSAHSISGGYFAETVNSVDGIDIRFGISF